MMTVRAQFVGQDGGDVSRAIVGDRFVDLVADQHQVAADDDLANHAVRPRDTVPTGFHGVFSSSTREVVSAPFDASGETRSGPARS
jgi:hypothetical protein